MDELPLLVGYNPEDAERLAAACGYTVCWVESTPPRWLPPRHGPRVLRQRQREAGVVELLRGEAPDVLAEPSE